MHLLEAKRESIPLGVDFVKKGFPVVLPTDTLYGICADATNPEAVEKVYSLKWRNPKKPLIVLISDLSWLSRFFNIAPSPLEERLLRFNKPVSVLLKTEGFPWISRGSGEIAFRLVKEGFIKEFLQELKRPIVAPSANWEGFPPARDIFQALLYFGNGVSVYYNGGILKGLPSALVRVEGNTLKVLRKGILTEKDWKFLKTEKNH